jgi:3'-phosphoadenosine 5'-phosphosulfate sulfotransferase (PAPS reductase)/FAD synthetase
MNAEQKAELIQRLNGRHVVASISGGKDSAALGLWLKEHEIPHVRVFMDTGWESDITYEYLRGTLTQALGPIVEISAARKMEELVRHKGLFPSRLMRFCTMELKVKPFKVWMDDYRDEVGDVVSAVGIRADESEARSKLAEWEWSEMIDCEIWRPIIRWSEQDVIDMHKRHGLAPNPLYLKGATRVGCWPCIYAKKDEIRTLATVDPQRIDKIRELEQYVTLRVKERQEAKGKTLEDKHAWFRGKGRTGFTAIDDVVKWSNTSRGGRQYELFEADPQDMGCVRWGLCDTAGDKK